jgi:hypothetical protein
MVRSWLHNEFTRAEFDQKLIVTKEGGVSSVRVEAA